MAIVAVVVTVLSYGTLSELGYGMVTAGAAAGAAGSIASQVVGNAIGVQDGFSWKGVALGAIGGVVSAGLGGANILPDTGSAFLNGAMRGALGSTITQGVAVVTGLQDKFSWKSVAASAVSAGVSQGLNSAMQYDPRTQFDFGKSFVSGFGGALVGTVVRGGKISGAQIAADAFGNIIGDALAKANNVPGVVGAKEKARILGYFADGPGTGFSFADDMAMRRASINPMGLPTTSATSNADGLYARNGMDVMDDTTDASGRRVVTVGQDQGPLAAFRSAGMSSAEAQAMYGQALATGQIRRNAMGMPIVLPGQTLYVDLNDVSQAGYGGNAISLESRNRAAIAEEQMRQAAQEATYRNENYGNEGRSRPTYVATTYDDTQRMLNRMWDTPSGQFAKAYYAAGAASVAQPVDGGGFGDSTNHFSNAGANIPLTQAANLAVGATELVIGGAYNQVGRILGGLASIPYTLAGTDAAVGVQEGFAESWNYSPRSDGAQSIMRGLAPVAQRVSNGIQAARDFTAGYIGDGATTVLFAGTQFVLEAGATVTGLRSLGSVSESLLVGKVGTQAFPERSVAYGPRAEGIDILSAKQLALHERLSSASFQGTRAIEAPWGTLSFGDVSALTKATGWEHAVVRLRDGSRMLMRGDASSVSDVLKLDVQRLIVHSHPGDLPYHLMPSARTPSGRVAGDLAYLWEIGQKRSYIVTSGTRAPGIDYWIGSFDNQGYWRALNTPPMMPTGGNVLR
ncbi:hypothetical protein QMO14_21535 [Variovorax sp. CAN2819]|uniref:hypothetical protein n=1 Tax=Variovorax sp. CAN15 TaxID=3046727 RepID=UPI00264886EE|nr:hypothetical protein [Variovorax sp. CAN15]MDN6886176.1 hypothetical protein [Variovorax sp. CAN15]